MSVKSLNEVLRRVNRGSRTGTRRRYEQDGNGTWTDFERVLTNAGLGLKDRRSLEDEMEVEGSDTITPFQITQAAYKVGGANFKKQIEDIISKEDWTGESRRRVRSRGRGRRSEEFEDASWAEVKKALKAGGISTEDIETLEDQIDPSEDVYLDGLIDMAGDFLSPSVAGKIEDAINNYSWNESHARTRGGAGRRGRRSRRSEDFNTTWTDMKKLMGDCGINSADIKEVGNYMGKLGANDIVSIYEIVSAISTVVGWDAADKVGRAGGFDPVATIADAGVTLKESRSRGRRRRYEMDKDGGALWREIELGLKGAGLDATGIEWIWTDMDSPLDDDWIAIDDVYDGMISYFDGDTDKASQIMNNARLF